MTASRPLEHRAGAAAWLAAPAGSIDLPGLVVHAAATLAAVAACGSGVVIALRRLSGAIGPAGPAPVLGAAAAGILLVVVADAARRAGGHRIGPLAARFGLLVAVAALACPPRATGAGDWLVIAAALLATAVTVGRVPRRVAVGARVPRAGAPAKRRRGASRREPQPGSLRQRFERRELPAGAERVRGRVVVAVPAGVKAGYGHLGFCPPFAATPTVEVTTAYDGVEASVAVAEVLPWGVRVECRLAEPAEEPLEIPVDLVALAAGPTH